MASRGWAPAGKDATFRKKRSATKSNRTHSTYTLRGRDISVQHTLRKLANQNKTLNSGNLLRIINIPEETMQDCIERVAEREADSGKSEEEIKNIAQAEATNEWLAANTVDFYNEVALLYGLVEDFHQKASVSMSHAVLAEEFKDFKPKFPPFFNGFPNGFEYRLKQANEPNARCNGADYVNLSMIWLEDQIDNPNIFPETEDDPFPAKFVDMYVAEMFKRMFRIFAIIYAVCWPIIVTSKAEAHVNTCFKHFYFFMKRFQLLKRAQDRDVFTKTRVKKIMDLDALDDQYQKYLNELASGK